VEALERQRERSGGRRHVFPAHDGEPRSEDMVPRLAPGNAKPAPRADGSPPPSPLERAGIARHVRFHDLRHTCASALLQGFWAPHWVARPLRLEEVKEWLGHTSIATTQRYAHLCPEAVQGLVIRTPPEAPPNAPKKVVQLASARERKRLKSAEE
jgi:integrase